MPRLWRVTMIVLVLCLLASIVIGTVRLTTTPTQIFGDGYRAWHGHRFPH